MSIALYRRYRPQTFDEVIGQDHVVTPLKSALAAGRTTHAYLFSGPRGCGKTTSARILARALNCAEYPTDTPCGKCDSCRELSRDGSGSLDVVELDAASHGGVDDARELREQAGFAPVRDRFKIYIIDEAHMVSKQGFNALLKLVEEPPEHVKFIFATTEPEKVIETVRSRTHHYPFRLVPPAELEKYLARLCAQENISAGHDVLSLVVRAGGGSVRDTLSVLDQIIGGSDGTKLDYERVIGLLRFTSAHLLDDAVTAIATGSGKELFGVVDAVIKTGHDPRRFVEDLLQRLRDLVIISLTGASAREVFVAVPDDQYERMTEQAKQLGARRASHCADLTNAALSEMMGATAPRMQLELLCARLLVADAFGAEAPAENVPALNFQKPSKPAPAAASAPASAPSSEAAPAPVPAPPAAADGAKQLAARNLDMVDPRRRPMPQMPTEVTEPPAGSVTPASPAAAAEPSVPNPPASAEAPATEAVPPTAGAVDIAMVQQRWQELTNNPELSRVVHSQLEQSSGPVALSDGVLQIGFTQPGLVNAFNRRSHGEFAAIVSKVLGQQLDVKAVATGTAAADSAADSHATDDYAAAPAADTPESENGEATVPKVEAAPVAAESDEPPVDDLPDNQILPDGTDPAGLLAQLIDHRSSAAEPEEEPAPAPAADTPADKPFYAQDMPAVPPANFPGTPPAAAKPAEQNTFPVAPPAVVNPATARAKAESAPSPSAPPVLEYDEIEEVSPDDPEISQSKLVGISVVLDKLGGTIVEEDS